MTDLQKWLDVVEGAWHARDLADEKVVPPMLAALRAVVELHEGVYDKSPCHDQQPGVYCIGCGDPWPCPTIRAVEKEVLRAPATHVDPRCQELALRDVARGTASAAQGLLPKPLEHVLSCACRDAVERCSCGRPLSPARCAVCDNDE
jgi:hypothetical protein